MAPVVEAGAENCNLMDTSLGKVQEEPDKNFRSLRDILLGNRAPSANPSAILNANEDDEMIIDAPAIPATAADLNPSEISDPEGHSESPETNVSPDKVIEVIDISGDDDDDDDSISFMDYTKPKLAKKVRQLKIIVEKLDTGVARAEELNERVIDRIGIIVREHKQDMLQIYRVFENEFKKQEKVLKNKISKNCQKRFRKEKKTMMLQRKRFTFLAKRYTKRKN